MTMNSRAAMKLDFYGANVYVGLPLHGGLSQPFSDVHVWFDKVEALEVK